MQTITTSPNSSAVSPKPPSAPAANRAGGKKAVGLATHDRQPYGPHVQVEVHREDVPSKRCIMTVMRQRVENRQRTTSGERIQRQE